MTPTVQTLGERIYQQLADASVDDSAHAVRVLALHAHRRRLTRAQLVHLLAQFAPRTWDLDAATVAAADRLLVDRGEHPDVGELNTDVGSLWPAAGPWPPDAGAGEDAARAEVAEAALAETPGPGRDGGDRPSAREWLHDRCQVGDHDGCRGTGGEQGCDCACHLPGDEAAETAAPEPEPDPDRPPYVVVDGHMTGDLVVERRVTPVGPRVNLSNAATDIGSIVLSVGMTPAQARVVGRQLIAAADEGEPAAAPGSGEPARCAAAHADDSSPCEGPLDAVQVFDRAGAEVTACVEHAATLLASLEDGRVYPLSVPGAAVEAYQRAQGRRRFGGSR